MFIDLRSLLRTWVGLEVVGGDDHGGGHEAKSFTGACELASFDVMHVHFNPMTNICSETAQYLLLECRHYNRSRI